MYAMNVIMLMVIFLLHTVQVTAELVKVSIYYEAFCSDSAEFIGKQFHPAFPKIESLLAVDFVPYGRAMHTWKNDHWEFQCHHGPDECFGNKIHACGIQENAGPTQTVEFVNCMMQHYSSDMVNALENCVSHLNVSSQKILECVKSSKGSDRLATYGNRTHALGHIKFIPTIIFDDKFRDIVQAAALHNFNNAVISYATRRNVRKSAKAICEPTMNFCNISLDIIY